MICKWSLAQSGQPWAPSQWQPQTPATLFVNDTSLLTSREHHKQVCPFSFYNNCASRPFVMHKNVRAQGDLCYCCLCATSAINTALNSRSSALRFTRHLSEQVKKPKTLLKKNSFPYSLQPCYQIQRINQKPCRTATTILPFLCHLLV